MRIIGILVVGWVHLALAPVAMAQDALFGAAVADWLRGQDATSLPVLADLAADGHADARILLAQIEIADRGLSPYLRALPRTERRALFRRVSRATPLGQSWLSVEAEAGNDIAAALLRARQPLVAPDLVYTLIANGEAQASNHPSRILALYGTPEQRETLRMSPSVPPESLPFLDYLSGPPEPRGDGLAALRHIAAEPQIAVDAPGAQGMAGLLALGYPFGDIAADNPWREAVESWLLTAPATRPLADLCDRQCETGQGACAVALMALIGGYFEVTRIDSPYEAVIPQADFLASPRARLIALRRAARARAETGGLLASVDEIAGISQCAADLVRQARTE